MGTKKNIGRLVYMKRHWLYKNNIQKLSPEEKLDIFMQIQKDIHKKHRQKRIRLYLSISAAACILLAIALLNPLIPILPSSGVEVLSHITDSIDNEKDIQLILANNKTITFQKDADIEYDGKGEITVNTGDELIKTSEISKDISLNTLIVPKGKRSSLTLSDGTKVWINSGTTLRFPSQFESKRREIQVEGEIFIDVVKDKTRPFYVNTSRMIIDVVGTKFNVSAYNEDEEHSVVLVEGCVDISIDSEKARLSPNQILSSSMNDISVKDVDVNNYISWKDGYLQFSSEPLKNILNRLSRYYDTPIYYDENSAALKCNGKLILFDNIKDVLETISNTIPISFQMEETGVSVQKKP